MSARDGFLSSPPAFDLQGIGMTSLRTRKRLIERLRQAGIRHAGVLDAMLNTPRHIFVDEALSHRAYEDTALPIGHYQTISQPFIVVRMTELLCETSRMERILEVGTGSGYQAAVLARLAGTVYTVERIEPLLSKARQRFRALGLNNIQSQLSDGTWGWPDKGPFDGIMVTAAPETLPEELMRQLADGGRMVIPLGGDGTQDLVVIDRKGDAFQRRVVEKVRFVPMLGGIVR